MDIINSASDCEIISVRIFNTPRELLFKAWSNPEHLKNWWGPKGFTNTFLEFDFRTGGRWRFIMHGPVKGNYKNECIFTEIRKPELIVWNRISKPKFIVSVLFEDFRKCETKLTFKMIFATPEECEKIKRYAVDKNEENFDRLETEIRKML